MQLPDAKGLRDLAVLLGMPGREITGTELVSGGVAIIAARSGADEVLDRRAREDYRARLARIDAELVEADVDGEVVRSARLSAEREAIVAELARATGLGVDHASSATSPSARAAR